LGRCTYETTDPACGDLFTMLGETPATTDGDIVDPASQTLSRA
jgi:hypothetical protein